MSVSTERAASNFHLRFAKLVLLTLREIHGPVWLSRLWAAKGGQTGAGISWRKLWV